MSLRDLHYVVARHRAEILLSGKLTGEDVSRLVLAREKGPLRDSLTEFPSSSFEEEGNRSLRRVYRYLEREEFSKDEAADDAVRGRLVPGLLAIFHDRTKLERLKKKKGEKKVQQQFGWPLVKPRKLIDPSLSINSWK